MGRVNGVWHIARHQPQGGFPTENHKQYCISHARVSGGMVVHGPGGVAARDDGGLLVAVEEEGRMGGRGGGASIWCGK